MEDVPDIDLFFTQIWLSQYCHEFKNPGGRAHKKALAIFRGYHLWFYHGEKDSSEVANHLVEKIIASPKFAKKINQEIIKWSDKLRNFAKTMPEDNLNKISNKKLLALIEKHDQIHTKFYQWGGIPVSSDMYHPIFTKRLQEYLRGLGAPEEKVNEYLVTLTQSDQKSLIQIEREELLQLALTASKDSYHKKLFLDLYEQFKNQAASERKISQLIDKIKPSLMKSVQDYYLKYFYIKHMWVWVYLNP